MVFLGGALSGFPMTSFDGGSRNVVWNTDEPSLVFRALERRGTPVSLAVLCDAQTHFWMKRGIAPAVLSSPFFWEMLSLVSNVGIRMCEPWQQSCFDDLRHNCQRFVMFVMVLTFYVSSRCFHLQFTSISFLMYWIEHAKLLVLLLLWCMQGTYLPTSCPRINVQ